MKNILVSGIFDLLHSGHYNLIYNASKLGSVYVTTFSDEIVFETKGKATTYDENLRVKLLSSLICVEKVILIKKIEDINKLEEFIKENNITQVVYGDDHSHKDSKERTFAKKNNLEIIFFDRTKNVSSTQIREYLSK